jgi:hypothetical protein
VAAFVGLCWMLASRRPRLQYAHGTVDDDASLFQPGEAPSSALAVSGADDIDLHLAGRACACAATAWSTPDLQRARYDERELTIVTRHCGACGREQSVYFTA